MASNISGMTGSFNWRCFLRGTVEEALVQGGDFFDTFSSIF